MTCRRSRVAGIPTAAAAVLAAAALAAASGCSKKDAAQEEARKFAAEFAAIRDDDINKGFFECLYGRRNLPASASDFIEQIKRRFESNTTGFLQEKSEGCRQSLDKAVAGLRALAAPSPEIGAALSRYTAAAEDMIGAWHEVHKAMTDFDAIENQRVEFRTTCAPLLEKAGNRGWAVMQQFQNMAEVDAFLAQDPGNRDAVENAYRYLDFVLCILRAYNVDPRALLVEDTTAAAEGRVFLKGVKALRDKLIELCSGEPGTPTHILEWSMRVTKQCCPGLESPSVQRPDLFEQIMLWWSSDGARDRASGEAYSSYAAIGDVCMKKNIDIAPMLREFLKTYGEFVTAARDLERAVSVLAR